CALLQAHNRRPTASPRRIRDVAALHEVRHVDPGARQPLMRYRRLFDLRLGGNSRVDAEMDLEIESHVAMRAADLERSGMSPAAACEEARRRFGNFDDA